MASGTKYTPDYIPTPEVCKLCWYAERFIGDTEGKWEPEGWTEEQSPDTVSLHWVLYGKNNARCGRSLLP